VLNQQSGTPLELVGIAAPINLTVATAALNEQSIIATRLAQTDALTSPTPNSATGSNNFNVSDHGVVTATPGAPLVGVTGIDHQYVNLTSDNLSIGAITPNVFIKTGFGDDVLASATGHNILDAGGGSNVMIGGGSQDSFLATMTSTTGLPETHADLIQGFRSGDDAVFRGLNFNDFTVDFTTSASADQLQIQLTAKDGSGVVDTVTVPGYTSDDVGFGVLVVGFSTTTNGAGYMFLLGV